MRNEIQITEPTDLSSALLSLGVGALVGAIGLVFIGRGLMSISGHLQRVSNDEREDEHRSSPTNESRRIPVAPYLDFDLVRRQNREWRSRCLPIGNRDGWKRRYPTREAFYGSMPTELRVFAVWCDLFGQFERGAPRVAKVIERQFDEWYSKHSRKQSGCEATYYASMPPELRVFAVQNDFWGDQGGD
jgi:hypothetical protein